MEPLSVYHGAITKDATERLLSLSGKDGSFLIRNSETIPGVYCLCVLFNKCVYTYRLHRTPGEAWIVESSPGSQKRLFRNVKNLIAAFEKPDQGIVMPLLYPVHAEKQSYQLNGR
ncbi:SH2 domain-containing protein 1A-like [Anguilla rostrata]|uniref:SH2 domain-containing protein 1A-like n=1 Tax=Anguilla anguilla TaxID=7936 RepID=UPI0015A9C25D|nr:SH2 domain-containing protein 1A-like [Anguilla anguilla]